MEKITFNKRQLLDELGIVETTLRVLIAQRGFPPPRKMGAARIFWLVAEVVQWLQGCPKVWGGGACDQAPGSGGPGGA